MFGGHVNRAVEMLFYFNIQSTKKEQKMKQKKKNTANRRR